MLKIVAETAPALPAERPRYLMGVGTPADLLEAVARGIDMFDCVLPTRNGRHGLAFTRFGPINIKNAHHADDPRPLDAESRCPAARDFSRAYLHHLFRSGETLGGTLLSLINLYYYQDLMAGARAAISAGRFADYVAETKEQWAARTRCSRGRHLTGAKGNPPAAEYAGPAGYSTRWVLTQTNQRHATHATNIKHSHSERPVAILVPFRVRDVCDRWTGPDGINRLPGCIRHDAAQRELCAKSVAPVRRLYETAMAFRLENSIQDIRLDRGAHCRNRAGRRADHILDAPRLPRRQCARSEWRLP